MRCLLLVSLLVALVACGGGPVVDGAHAEVQALLDRRAEAVLGEDAAAYARTGTRAGYDSLREVPLADWSYRVNAVHRTGDTATVDADLGYRVEGYDRAPVTTARTLRLSRDEDGRWAVVSDRPAGKSGRQLWDQGAVRAVHGERSLVLGVGQTDVRLRDYAALADRAVPAVSDAWGPGWARRSGTAVSRQRTWSPRAPDGRHAVRPGWRFLLPWEEAAGRHLSSTGRCWAPTPSP